MLNFKRSVYDQKNIFIINTSHRKKNHYTHAQGTRAKLLCQFCAISLQKPVILLSIPKYISPFIILIILTLFVAVFPYLPMTYDF